ncbi:MAG: hypothetical protein ACTTG4_06660 [Moraxella sp.]|jgi:hypothetical protein
MFTFKNTRSLSSQYGSCERPNDAILALAWIWTQIKVGILANF